MQSTSFHQSPSALITAYLDDLFAMHPYVASKAGLHQFDGCVPDWRSEAIALRLAALRRYQEQLAPLVATACMMQSIEAGALRLSNSALPYWDARLALVNVRSERFFWEVWRPHQTNPLIYLPLLDVSGYVKRPYAPLYDRLTALIRHCTAIPDLLIVARQHLRSPLARSLVQQSITTYESVARFHAIDLVALMQHIADPALLGAFTRANRAVVGAYRAFIGILRGMQLNATSEIGLGATHLHDLLATGEMVDLAPNELIALGEADLAHNHDRLVMVAARLGTSPEQAIAEMGRNHPPSETILDRTRLLNEEIRQFVIERALVTVPNESRCLVQATQPFMRNGSAYMDVPGPLETAELDAYFYLTMPDPSWTNPQKEAWLAKQSIPGLANTTIHEAWPGHFLQFLHLRRAMTLASKLFVCTSFVEGWAHYAEQLLIEQGFHADDPHYELHQLSMALLRDSRFLVALRLHMGQMSLEDAAHFIAHEAFFTPIRAQQEALRGVRAPGYLNYTLGKLLLLRLRADLQRRYPGWSLCTLHDTLLAFGAPPIPLLREVLLGEVPMVPSLA